MKTTPSISALALILLLISSCSSADDHEDFLECLSEKFQNYSSISKLVYTPSSSNYSSVLLSPIWNLRYTSNTTPKPQVIITPEYESQIPPIILCAKENEMEVRIRSGGHDFAALSSVAKVSFLVIDLIKLTEITVDAKAKTAWVQAGATTGSLYYRIAEKSSTLAFPGGIGITLGVGGHISGGGYGTLLRKYGLAADHVIDARIVDANGRILNRKSMGEDLFWAIRGGGGASFGVILAWKLQLVDVPERVTVFNVRRTLEQNLTQLLYRWQYVAPRLDNDITLLIDAMVINSNQTAGRNVTIVASFFALFLGGTDKLLAMMQYKFPELGLVREDLTEMSWIQSTLYFYGLPVESPEILLNRTSTNKSYMARKLDYVQRPIPEEGLEGLTRLYFEPEARMTGLGFAPYGGIMDKISKSAIPFPHRAGNLFHVFYTSYWLEADAEDPSKYVNWVNKAYSYMTPYASKNPRSAYLNYRDLGLGANNVDGKTSYAQASIWGKKYFNNNFDRLVQVKTKVDPDNFFRYEQSIPSLH